MAAAAVEDITMEATAVIIGVLMVVAAVVEAEDKSRDVVTVIFAEW